MLARGGLYAELYEQQFQGGRVELQCEDGTVFTDGNIVYAEDAGAPVGR